MNSVNIRFLQDLLGTTKEAHMCRDEILKAFKAEGGALGMKALFKRTKGKQPKEEVLKELKKMKSEGIVKEHKHGDLYTTEKSAESHCAATRLKKLRAKGQLQKLAFSGSYNKEVDFLNRSENLKLINQHAAEYSAKKFNKKMSELSDEEFSDALGYAKYKVLPGMYKLAEQKKDPRLARAGVSGYNQVKRTPNHPTKSHIVVAKEGDRVKTIRFGQQGVKTNQTAGQREAFKSRHAKNIARGKMSAAYWADKAKWSPKDTQDKKNKKWVKGS